MSARSLTYTKFELRRTFRNRRVFIFTLAFPIVMYYLIAGPQKGNDKFASKFGIDAPLYYMVGLLGFGAMVAALSGGARIAAERQVGWNRQLRLTPLSPREYFRTKIVTSYALVVCAILLMTAAGLTLGVRLPFDRWVHMAWLVLLALIPFAGLGIALGHLINTDSFGPVMGGGTSLFAFLGGTWFPITGNGLFVGFCKLLPSYWLTQAGHAGLGGNSNPWGTEGWVAIGAWAAAAAAFAMWAYRRDTKRVS
jgi:ABC-2 type transport system permease protein